MKTILDSWLKNEVGVVVDFDTINVTLKDGMLFIRILKYYDAINVSSIKNVFPSEDESVCRNNLTQLKIWFKLIDIDFNDHIIDEIIKGNPSLCIDILYRLFIAFRKFDLHLVTKQKEKRIVEEECGQRFHVSPAKLPSILSKSEKFNSAFLCRENLLKNREIIKWYKEKHGNDHIGCKEKTDKTQYKFGIQPKCGKESFSKTKSSRARVEDVKYVREKLNQFSQCNVSSDDNSIKQFCTHYSYSTTGNGSKSNKMNSFLLSDNLSGGFLPPLKNLQLSSECVLPSNVQHYIKELKSTTGFPLKKRSEKSYSTLILKHVWDTIVKIEKTDIRDIIARRLIKQSLYEKDLASKFVCIMSQNEMQKECFSDFENHITKVRKSTNSMNVCDSDVIYCSREDGRKSNERESIIETSDNKGTYLGSPSQRYIHIDPFVYRQNEKKRTVELHRKLYAEKLKSRFERHYVLCSQAIHDIIDLSIKRSVFKSEYDIEVPDYIWNEWKCLFYHEQPIFDVVTNVMDLLFPNDTNDFNFIVERARQDILNESSLDTYLDVKDSWSYVNLVNRIGMPDKSGDSVAVTFDNEAQLLLGYIVHRVLETKYPLPPKQSPADIPCYRISAVINDFDNVKAVQDLRDLLMKAGILLIDVNTAVNFCLQCYKDTIGADVNVQQELQSTILSFSSYDDQKFDACVSLSEMEFNTAATQTTSSLFKINVSNNSVEAANLGRVVLKMLLSGYELSFSVLSDVIIQYIKSYENKINGWVIVNFPSSLYQASIFEYTLSGKTFPFQFEDDKISCSSDCKVSVIGKDMMSDSTYSAIDIEVRSSRIVPNPVRFEQNEPFKSYFSMYVTTVKGTKVFGNEYTNFSMLSEHSESTLLLEQPEKEGVPTLDRFYQEHGITYDFIYESFDLDTLKQLAGTVMMYFFEDSKMQRVPDNFYNAEVVKEFESSILKWVDPDLRSSRSSVQKSGQSSSSTLNVDEPDLNTPNNENISSQAMSDKYTNTYTNLPVLDSAMLALSLVWETLETIYLNNVREMFFVKRNWSFTAIPYIAFICKQMNFYLNMEDDRQQIVTEFLAAYNDIHETLRSDIEMKNELHLRVVELKERLAILCKEKRDRIGTFLEIIIKHNWNYFHMTLYTNFFINFMQIEVNRCVRTFNFLQDYYMAMLDNYRTEPLADVEMSKINIHIDDRFLSKDDVSENGEFDSSEQSMVDYDFIVPSIDDPVYSLIIKELLNYNQNFEITSFLCALLRNKAQNVMKSIIKIKSKLDGVIVNEETSALKNNKDNNPKSVAKKKGSSKAETANQNLEPEVHDAKEESIKQLFEEWRIVVQNEVDRCSFRLELLELKFKDELMEIESLIGSKFAEIKMNLDDHFNRETTCIDNLCLLLQTAIEEKSKINAEIIFESDAFYTIIDEETPELPLIRLPAALEELIMEESFTIEQLHYLKKRLMYIAPNGTLNQSVLVSCIQDAIPYAESNGSGKLVPAIWCSLERHEIEVLVLEIFGNCSIIEWRDFLICCLDLPYPLTEDIIDARLQFLRYDLEETEFISYEDYMNTTLWFERELPKSPLHALRNVLAKEFIFALFKINDTVINYISLLLSFCRDVDPKVGFGKALSLILGKCVIVYKEDLYLEQILQDHIDTEMKVVDDIINEILDDVVNNAISDDCNSLSDIKDVFRPGKLDSSNDTSASSVSNTGGVFTNSMYHQFFRRHLIFQWTSKVPSMAIIALLCVTFHTIYIPDSVFLHNPVFEALRRYTSHCNDDYVFVPDFINFEWINVIFDQIHKFNAFSINDVIRSIIKQRKP